MSILRFTLPNGQRVTLQQETGSPVEAEAVPEPAGGLVLSVFGRTGNVTAAAGDYAASEITNDSGVAGANVAVALDNLAAAIVSAIGAGLSRVAPVLVSASGVTGTLNDWAPTDLHTADLLLVNTTGNATITGIAAPAVASDNRLLAITHHDFSSDTNTITIEPISGGSLGPNRIATPGRQPLVLKRYESAWLWYNGNEWAAVAVSQSVQTFVAAFGAVSMGAGDAGKFLPNAGAPTKSNTASAANQRTSPIAGAIKQLGWNSDGADATTVFHVYKNGALAQVVNLTGAAGVVNLAPQVQVAAGDTIAVWYESGQAPTQVSASLSVGS